MKLEYENLPPTPQDWLQTRSNSQALILPKMNTPMHSYKNLYVIIWID